MVKVYIDGVFDLFHVNHIHHIQAARKFGDYLIVGVITDKDCESYKRTPIIPYEERVEMVQSCKYVDEVVEGQLYLTKEFLEKHKIDLVVHAEDASQNDFFKVPIDMGIMRYVPYFKGTNTSSIIERIQKN